MEMGPAVRGLIDSAAAAAMARDALEATLLLKRLASGLPLVELVPPPSREELTFILDAVRRRTETSLASWAAKRRLPEVEIQVGLETYERCAAAEMNNVLKALTPGDTPRATLEKAVKECGARCGVLEEVVERDIGWALVKSAIAAAEDYKQPLSRLAPPPLSR
jgi:uncharacterized protein with PIN domain